ncbi:MAG: quinolinate synthase NadA, partial [Candidatus Eremiobacteraeota bacterium]|nr:quinolinate synthase NadA [Candidatus Eremiobacteraeota bacterium]
MSVLDLPYTPDVAAETDPIFRRVAQVIPPVEWPLHAPYVAAITRLKRERNAVILAHNYQVPEIFYTVADIVGDSLALAMQAAQTNADVIVLCGVHFMAETAKLVNPTKTVLVPDLKAGCSLAESITGADVRLLRERYPGVPIVTYVNTSAEVKAESDVCVTSGNAVHIVEALGVPRVIFLPDEYLGKWVASQLPDVELILWKGHCEVHERFTGEELRRYRAADPTLHILAHPECPPDVLAEADYVGSTAGMIRHLDETPFRRVVMVTECSMSDNVADAHPQIEFVRPCNLCPHMKRITLPKVLRSLET